jgi:hypothetical protein
MVYHFTTQSMSSQKPSVVGVYGSAPLSGRLADSRGPRVSLALSFSLLLTGYLGIKAVYDASEHSTGPAGSRTLFTLMLFELVSGAGSVLGYMAALNSVAKSFPSKIVSPDSRSTAPIKLTPLSDVANDRDGNRRFWVWVIGFHFFYCRPYGLPRQHVRLLAYSGIRDSHPYGARLVLYSPLPVP